MSLVRTIARPLLAAPFVLGGLSRLRAPEASAAALRPLLARVSRTVPALQSLGDRPAVLARAIGGVQIGAGALLALGRLPRTSSALIVAAQALTLTTERPSPESSRADRLTAVVTQAGLTGGALLAAVDTNGRPSLAWRAKDAGARGQKFLAKETRKAKKALA
ncbi:MAG: DoxX family membrane protein [Arthrobacter sp.]|jgi:uncharacterized membrane protein YphA (DoxX/SURF4 family)|nr:DoxX family membrane protein [Arthrobacter sp.]